MRPGGGRPLPGVEHRIELVRELDGVKYYNDSIGTSPSRTVACLESFPEPVILIAGGYDKGIPFHALALEIRGAGQDPDTHRGHGPAIRQAVEEAEGGRGCPEIIQTEDLAGAVEAARRAAGPGDVVVLSPPARPSTASRTSWSGPGVQGAGPVPVTGSTKEEH